MFIVLYLKRLTLSLRIGLFECVLCLIAVVLRLVRNLIGCLASTAQELVAGTLFRMRGSAASSHKAPWWLGTHRYIDGWPFGLDVWVWTGRAGLLLMEQDPRAGCIVAVVVQHVSSAGPQDLRYSPSAVCFSLPLQVRACGCNRGGRKALVPPHYSVLSFLHTVLLLDLRDETVMHHKKWFSVGRHEPHSKNVYAASPLARSPSRISSTRTRLKVMLSTVHIRIPRHDLPWKETCPPEQTRSFSPFMSTAYTVWPLWSHLLF